jgi:hypothetical protein
LTREKYTELADSLEAHEQELADALADFDLKRRAWFVANRACLKAYAEARALSQPNVVKLEAKR